MRHEAKRPQRFRHCNRREPLRKYRSNRAFQACTICALSIASVICAVSVGRIIILRIVRIPSIVRRISVLATHWRDWCDCRRYDGDRTLKKITKFIVKNAAIRFELPEKKKAQDSKKKEDL